MEVVDVNGLSSLAAVPAPTTPQRGKHPAMLEQSAGSTDRPFRRTTIRVIAPQEGCLAGSFLFQLFYASAARGTIKSENGKLSDVPSVQSPDVSASRANSANAALDPRKWPLLACSGTPSTRSSSLEGSMTDKQ
jgi:hypothetical protein